MIRILIPEPIPSTNKGELAILEGIRESLNYIGEYELTVYSPQSWFADDKRNSKGNYKVVGGVDLWDLENLFSGNTVSRGKIHTIKTWGKLLFYSLMHRLTKNYIIRYFKDPLLKALCDTDIILAGHDGLLSPSHFYLALSASIMKKPLVLFGGSHRLQGKAGLKTRKYFQYMIKRAILCTVRDPRTKEYFALNNIFPDKIHVFPDPALMLRPCEDSRIKDILAAAGVPQGNGQSLYGLIPVHGGVISRTSYTFEDNMKHKYQRRIELWEDVLSHLNNITDAHFIFIPHCIGPVQSNDDRRISRDIYNAFPGDKRRITLIESEYSPSELKGLIKYCDYLLGERAHGLIGAVSVGTPCMALTTAEDLRMHYMMEKVFDRPTFNLNNPNVEELKSLLENEWVKRKQTANVMTRKAEELHAAAKCAAELLRRKVLNALSES